MDTKKFFEMIFEKDGFVQRNFGATLEVLFRSRGINCYNGDSRFYILSKYDVASLEKDSEFVKMAESIMAATDAYNLSQRVCEFSKRDWKKYYYDYNFEEVERLEKGE